MICFHNLLLTVTVFLQHHSYSHGFYMEHDYKNIQCRDNADEPVDWWYIYKPPKNSGRYLESGDNFTYITSSNPGRLQPSRTYINHNSMVQFTLAPLYEPKLKESLAVMSYGYQPTDTEPDAKTSTALGVLFANSLGGVWISHTIPDFPDLSKSTPLVEDEEYRRGHMIICLTLDLKNLNTLATVVRHADPKITKFSLPDSLSLSLSKWALIETETKLREKNSIKTHVVSFMTKGKTLKGRILARGPNDPRCLYTIFAKLQGLVIDVYNKDRSNPKPFCEPEYSVRYINKISIKFPESQVCYINQKNDRISFGVSNGAAWQRGSRNSRQFWTCTGNHDRQGHLLKGQLIICVENSLVWFGFDNLKVKEPEC